MLVFSQHLVERFVTELVGEDARGVGYLLKHRIADLGYFTDAVRTVAQGGTALDPEVVARMFGRRRRTDPLEALTPREREVLALMAEGLSNQGIAERLTVAAARGGEARDVDLQQARHRPRPGREPARARGARAAARVIAARRRAAACPRAGRHDLERAAEHREPVLQAAQAGARVEIGAAAAVVGDLDHQRVAVAPDRDLGDRRLRVLGHVGQRLGDGEVGGGLDLGREALLGDVELDGDRRARRQLLQRDRDRRGR